jgi:hypothetical protein
MDFHFDPPVAIEEPAEEAMALLKEINTMEGAPGELYIEANQGFAHFEFVRNSGLVEIAFRGHIESVAKHQEEEEDQEAADDILADLGLSTPPPPPPPPPPPTPPPPPPPPTPPPPTTSTTPTSAP